MSVKNAALYIRVSTHLQEELSPDAQKRLLLDHAKTNGYHVSEEFIFIENGISGRKAAKRPEFQRMIGFAKQKPAPFDTIFVWKFSRFARNQEESIVYKSLLRKQCNIDVISISEPTVDGPFGSLIERIIEWMDEYYSIRLSGEVIRGMTEKALRGENQSGPALGYRVLPDHQGLEIIPDEALIVAKIYDLYVNEGYHMFDIAKHINDLGYRTKRGNKFDRRGIEYILKNPKYISKARWNYKKHGSYYENPIEEQIFADSSHESIITEEIYKKAQERIKKEYTPRKKRPGSTYKHWLSGILCCPICNSTLTFFYRERNGHKYAYFRCYKYAHGKCECNQHIPVLNIEEEIKKHLSEAVHNPDMEFEEKLTKTISSEECLSNITLLQKQLDRIEIKLTRIKEAYQSGIDTLEEYTENKKNVLNERQLLKEKIYNQNIESDETVSKEKIRTRIHDVVDILNGDFSIEEKSKALNSVVDHITYFKAKDSLDIYYKS